MAFDEVKKHIVKAGVVVDAIDIGGGFPSRYTDSVPARLSDFIDVIKASMAKMPVTEHCRLDLRARPGARRGGREPDRQGRPAQGQPVLPATPGLCADLYGRKLIAPTPIHLEEVPACS